LTTCLELKNYSWIQFFLDVTHSRPVTDVSKDSNAFTFNRRELQRIYLIRKMMTKSSLERSVTTHSMTLRYHLYYRWEGLKKAQT